MLKLKIAALLLVTGAIKAVAQNAETPTPQWRPMYHFSPPTNWTNDPNGLIFLNGVFQLYYQHNPFENKWGHMSWGHATSKDLVHWENLPVAMPEIVTKDTTTWIYSGSVVSDTNNTSGFGTNGSHPLVAIFTADQPKQKKESQFVAYSNDNGLSFKQYASNPVIDLNRKDFRDPNVFWYSPTKEWIMAVSMVDDHMIRIYGSKNLKEWVKLSDFGPAGFTKNGWECPSLLPLIVDNDPAKVKWVLLVSAGGPHGPFMQYFIGDFDGTTFINSNPQDKVLTVDYGDAFYAAIAWRDAPGNKKVLLGWLQSGKRETYPWKGQMSIPRDLSLKTTAEGLKLFQPPSSIVSGPLFTGTKNGTLSEKDISINGKEITLSSDGHFDGNSTWINAEFLMNDAKKAGFNIAVKMGGNGIVSKKITVGYDAVKQELFIDCTNSEKENKSEKNLIMTAPMKPVNGMVKIQVLLDKSSLELIGNDGEKAISTMIYPDDGAMGISAFSEGKSVIKSLQMWDLSHCQL